MNACCNKNKPSHLYSARQTYIHTERNKGSGTNKKEREKQWRKELINKGGRSDVYWTVHHLDK
jgi:hypothetical protein